MKISKLLIALSLFGLVACGSSNTSSGDDDQDQGGGGDVTPSGDDDTSINKQTILDNITNLKKYIINNKMTYEIEDSQKFDDNQSIKYRTLR